MANSCKYLLCSAWAVTHSLGNARIILVNRFPGAEEDVCRLIVLHIAAKPLPQQVQDMGPGSPEPSSTYSLTHFRKEDGSTVLGDINVSPEAGNERGRGGSATWSAG